MNEDEKLSLKKEMSDRMCDEGYYGLAGEVSELLIQAAYSGWDKSETDKLDALLKEIINEH